MHFDNELHAAGQRAARQAVPVPPPVAGLQQAAERQRTKRRTIGSSLAAAALVVAAVPAALAFGGSNQTQVVVAGTEQVAAAAEGAASATAGAGAQTENGQPMAQSDEATEDVRLQFSADGSTIVARVVSGDEADTGASEAEAAADETLAVDGTTVWVRSDGDQRIVSALVETDTFVEITGPADQLDRLIEALRNGGSLTSDEWESFFGDDFAPFSGSPFAIEGNGDNFSFRFEHDGHHVDLDELFGNLEERFGDLEGHEFDFDFDGGDFDFDDVNPEDFDFEHFGRFDFDNFNLEDLEDFDFENFNLEDFGEVERFMAKNFSGCISINADGDNGDDFRFEYPAGCDSEN